MKKDQSMLTALAGLLLTILNSGVTVCACGHLDMISVPGNVIGFALTTAPFIKAKQQSLARRLVIDACFIATTLWMIKNIVDILWMGHNPILIKT